jgi:hypothetical protein
MESALHISIAGPVRWKPAVYHEFMSGQLIQCRAMLSPRMLGGVQDAIRWTRSSLAVSLTLLFSLVSLAPLAAQTFLSSGTACCRTKGDCCCHKATGHHGPAISAQSCANDCRQSTLGNGATSVYGSPVADQWTSTTRVISQANVFQFSHRSAIPSSDLRQRPPPSIRQT